MVESEPSYIDYEAFLDPSFSPIAFANALVTATNNASDTPIDLSTPLSRVLFDVQEIDTHIHTLTTTSALPILTETKDHHEASRRIADELETQVASLTDSYQRLEENVIHRYEAAEHVRLAAERLWQTVKIGRAVGRCLLLGRQLEAQMAEFQADGTGKKDDYRAMVRASTSIHNLRQIFAASRPGEEGEHLSRVHVILTLQTDLLTPSELKIRVRAQQIVREFSMSSLLLAHAAVSTAPSAATPSTYDQIEEAKARTTSACLALYLLSPPPSTNTPLFQPSLLLAALQSYLQTSLTSSLAALARALATLSTLTRTLLEVSARCQNIVALETLLESIPAPASSVPPMSRAIPKNLLEPLLLALDTSSLPSFFWRSLASGLSGRAQEIMMRGGVSARTLKSQRDRVKESIRECVLKGCQGAKGVAGGWEREISVMVGSVVGSLGR